MKRGSVIKSSPLSCVLPLGTFAGLSNVEQRARRLLQTPTPPFLFYSPESLASIHAAPSNIDLATQATVVTDGEVTGFVVTPDVYFGFPKSLPRAIRAAVVFDFQVTDAAAALYAAAYASEGLADKGVHLYVFSSPSVFLTNPLAGFAPLESQEAASRTIVVSTGPSAGSYPTGEQLYESRDLTGVPGGEVYAAFVGGSAYGFGVQGAASSSFSVSDSGYVTEFAEFRATGDPTSFAAVTITGYDVFASGTFPTTGGDIKRTFLVATGKASDDAANLEMVAARCEDFRFTFWTLPADSDGGGPLFGNPAGVLAAMGVESQAGWKQLAGAAGVRDLATSITEIVGDIAAFFA